MVSKRHQIRTVLLWIAAICLFVGQPFPKTVLLAEDGSTESAENIEETIEETTKTPEETPESEEDSIEDEQTPKEQSAVSAEPETKEETAEETVEKPADAPTEPLLKETAKPETAPAKNVSPAFNETLQTDRLNITVTAAEGILPEQTSAEAELLNPEYQDAVNLAVAAANEDKTPESVQLFTVHLRAEDKTDAVIEGEYALSFRLPDSESGNTELKIYRISETEAGIEAAACDNNAISLSENNAVFAAAYYKNVFTYSVAKAGTASVDDILSSLGISAAVTDASLSEADGLTLVHEDVWKLTAVKGTWEQAVLTVYAGESGTEITLINAIPETEEAKPAFDQKQTVGSVMVRVTAEEGVFPESAVLSVRQIPVSQTSESEQAVEEKRDENVAVAVSYTYDISVLDQNGNELQPADQSKVNVFFSIAEAADENLETAVYHVKEEKGELNAEELKPETEGETVSVETEGFSIYVVEFVYNKMEYILPGDTSVLLSVILDSFGLNGTVTDAVSSNPALFSAEQNEGEWLIRANEPFTSEETLHVVINGITYEIKVYDAVNPSDFTGRLISGGTLSDFDKSLPLTTVTVNRDVVSRKNYTAEALNPAITISNMNGYPTANYNGTVNKANITEIDGPLCRFVYKNAVHIANGETADLEITYSDLKLFLPVKDANGADIAQGTTTIKAPFAQGVDFMNFANVTGGDKGCRVGQQADARVRVVKDGYTFQDRDAFMFTVTDIDVDRRNNVNFMRIYKANEYDTFSEQLEVVEGAISEAFIPDASSYLTDIVLSAPEKSLANGLLWVGNQSESDPGTFNSGMVTLAKADEGILLRMRNGANNVYTIKSFLMSGIGMHRLKSSSGPGGWIKTTSDGNHSGKLIPESGHVVLDEGEVGVPNDKTVVYTMKPEPGYILESVEVGPYGGPLTKTDGYLTERDDDGNVYYTYRFQDIQSDQEIHVSWRRVKLTVSKTVSGTMGNKDKYWEFTLTVKDASGNPLTNLTGSGITGWKNNNDVTYSFKLRHGDSKVIEGIPLGGTYQIEEESAGGYTQTHSIDGGNYLATGNTAAQRIHGDASVSFRNSWEIAPDVGVKDDQKPAVFGIGLAVLLLGSIFLKREYRNS